MYVFGMLELKEEHRLHNKKYKKDLHLALMVMDFDTYLKFRFGKIKTQEERQRVNIEILCLIIEYLKLEQKLK